MCVQERACYSAVQALSGQTNIAIVALRASTNVNISCMRTALGRKLLHGRVNLGTCDAKRGRIGGLHEYGAIPPGSLRGRLGCVLEDEVLITVHGQFVEGMQTVVGLEVADSLLANGLVDAVDVGSRGTVDLCLGSVRILSDSSRLAAGLGNGNDRGLEPYSGRLILGDLLDVDNTCFVPSENIAGAVV